MGRTPIKKKRGKEGRKKGRDRGKRAREKQKGGGERAPNQVFRGCFTEAGAGFGLPLTYEALLTDRSHNPHCTTME